MKIKIKQIMEDGRMMKAKFEVGNTVKVVKMDFVTELFVGDVRGETGDIYEVEFVEEDGASGYIVSVKLESGKHIFVEEDQLELVK